MKRLLVCMLCRYYDLPFRREVIKNILTSYLNKSPQKVLNIEFICSLIELNGISSNPINPKDINYLKEQAFQSYLITKIIYQ